MPKKKVFLSSPGHGMRLYRANVAEMMAKSDVFDLIAMEHFGARSATPAEHYLRGIEQCDIFVGLVGPRFGACPDGDTRSHSEIEYETSKRLGKPQLMFMVKGEEEEGARPQTPEQAEQQANFRARVISERLVAFPSSVQSTATEVLTALVNQLRSSMDPVVESTRKQIETIQPDLPEHRHTWLLFPFVSHQAGFDTGVSIVNTSAQPHLPQSDWELGPFNVHFYGTVGTSKYTISHPGPTLMGGEHAVWSLGSGGAVQATPGFQGYLVVHCAFRASGFAYIYALAGENKALAESPIEVKHGSCYLATELPQNPRGISEALLPQRARTLPTTK